MKLAQTASAIIVGVDAHIIDVEAHLADGLVGTAITGLADTSINESRDRVRAAISSTGFSWPQQRITIGLSPAWLPKRGSALDLAIALAVLAADGRLPAELVHRTLVIGELGLDGSVRPVRGVLPMVLAAKRWGFHRVVVPFANTDEASLVPELQVFGVGSLGHALRLLGVDCEVGSEGDLVAAVDEVPPSPKDLSEVRGQVFAKLALEVAAAGGHHIALLGPPGVGKTLLAERMPGILPPLEPAAALEVTAIRSVLSDHPVRLQTVPPFAAPHHGASAAALIGGGAVGTPKAGLITAAHRGVLFLDEAPEFAINALEALRQPLESGNITIARAGFAVVLPARFQLVMAANPCPCGHALDSRAACNCSAQQRMRYLSRISGPLMDRIDVRVLVETPTPADIELGSEQPIESSAVVAQRVCAARARQQERLAGTPWRTNAEVPGPVLRKRWVLPNATRDFFNREVNRRDGTSVRGLDRMLRLAWTVADLADHPAPTPDDLDAAMTLRDAGGRWPS